MDRRWTYIAPDDTRSLSDAAGFGVLLQVGVTASLFWGWANAWLGDAAPAAETRFATMVDLNYEPSLADRLFHYAFIALCVSGLVMAAMAVYAWLALLWERWRSIGRHRKAKPKRKDYLRFKLEHRPRSPSVKPARRRAAGVKKASPDTST